MRVKGGKGATGPATRNGTDNGTFCYNEPKWPWHPRRRATIPRRHAQWGRICPVRVKTWRWPPGPTPASNRSGGRQQEIEIECLCDACSRVNLHVLSTDLPANGASIVFPNSDLFVAMLATTAQSPEASLSPAERLATFRLAAKMALAEDACTALTPQEVEQV